MRIRFEAQLLAGTRWDEEARTFVAHAPALNLYSQGPTEEEAQRAIESAIRLYLVTAYNAGILDRVLKRHGFTANAGTGQATTSAQQYIDVLEERNFGRIIDVPTAVDLTPA